MSFSGCIFYLICIDSILCKNEVKCITSISVIFDGLFKNCIVEKKNTDSNPRILRPRLWPWCPGSRSTCSSGSSGNRCKGPSSQWKSQFTNNYCWWRPHCCDTCGAWHVAQHWFQCNSSTDFQYCPLSGALKWDIFSMNLQLVIEMEIFLEL